MKTERLITALRSQIADARNLDAATHMHRSCDKQVAAKLKELGYGR